MRLESEPRHIGETTFTVEGQQLFASMSLDRNPMHMDANAARRLVTGRQVVHGIHVLIAAIERWQNEGDSPLASMSCIFNSPVSVNDRVVFTQSRGTENGCTLEARVDRLLCAQITIETDRSAPPVNPPEARAATGGMDIRIPTSLDHPLDETPESHLNKNYIVEINRGNFSVNFPRAYEHLGARRFAGLCALSRFVGMVCPGLHSIFSSLSLEPDHSLETEDAVAFRVRKYDHRSRLFDIQFQGCIRGSVRAFLRPPPQDQPSMEELSAHVIPQEFRGTRSLVIGGSRGLGEVTAKALASGGGEVLITYASGIEDAERIRDEIRNSGRSHCELLKLDLTKDSLDAANVDFSALTAVYFFATPRIYRKKADTFDSRLFHEFCDMYVGKFYELCVHLEASSTHPVKVFFPSSVFVSERPKGLAEYAMAKAAAEVLIEEINRSFKQVSVVSVRLPRLSTDQTATVLKTTKEPNLETLLPIIRAVSKSDAKR